MHSACGQLCGKSLHGSKEELTSLQNRQVVVKSMISEKIETDDGSKTTQYHFRCCALLGNEDTSWEVRRQEKDFWKLHLHLKKKGCVSVEFPSKSFISAFGSGLLMRRREDAMKDYLNSVLSHCNDEQCVLLCKFLRVNKHVQLCRPQSLDHHSEVLSRNHESSWKTSKVSDSSDDCRKQGRITLASVPYSSLYSKQQDDSSSNTQTMDHEPLMVPYSSSDDDSQYERLRSSRRVLQKTAETKDAGMECVFCCEEGDSPTRPNLRVPAPPPRMSKSDLLHQQKALLADLKLRQSARLSGDARLAGICEGLSAKSVDKVTVPDSSIGKVHVSGVAGIGLVFVLNSDGQQKGLVTVDEILEGSSAESDGTVIVGDRLISVDGVCISAKDLTQIRHMIVGNVGTLVTLKFERGGPWHQEARSFTVRLFRGQSSDSREISPSKLSMPISQSKAISLPNSQAKAISPTLDIPRVPDQNAKVETVSAIFPFCAARPHELNLEPGDQITVLRQHSSGWWEGRSILNGATGWFPSNHVQTAVPSSSGSNSPLSEPDSAGSKDVAADSSSSTKSLSLRSTVHASLSANSSDSGGSHSRKEKGSNVEEVCSWLKTVDLKEALDSKRGSLGLGSSYAVGGLALR